MSAAPETLVASAVPDESPVARTRRARRMYRALHERYPYAHCELDFTNPLELLVATILSAQTTDQRVNMVTPHVFARYPDAAAYAGADRTELETMIQSTGFFRNKSDALIKLGGALVERFDGEVPGRLADLVTLPGVGRKTANVVLGNAFGVPGITVDTHFGRLVRRFGWTDETDPVKVEHLVGGIFPRRDWTMLSHVLIFHGRRTCHAKKPACGACPVAAWCPSYGTGPTDRDEAVKLLAYELKPGALLPAPPPGPLPAPVGKPRRRPVPLRREGRLTRMSRMPSLAGPGETLHPLASPSRRSRAPSARLAHSHAAQRGDHRPQLVQPVPPSGRRRSGVGGVVAVRSRSGRCGVVAAHRTFSRHAFPSRPGRVAWRRHRTRRRRRRADRPA